MTQRGLNKDNVKLGQTKVKSNGQTKNVFIMSEKFTHVNFTYIGEKF